MRGRMVDALSPVGGLKILKHVSPLPAVALYLLSACPNGELDNSKYASPMPTIGLYIALGSLVCFLCMLFDMCYGFYRRQPWLPCKLFSVNSFTMTIISVATKLSVDLTTPMPRAIEQLSKLTSSAFLCIAMGFLMPSLATSRTSDSIANLASLSVLVISVVVNVSIQISTGVIFAFILEHVIVLICMSVLLALLCSSTLLVNLYGDASGRAYIEVAKETPPECGLKGMRQQLEHFYKVSCGLNPQFFCCETSYCSCVGLLCSLVVAVTLEAALRSLGFKELRFCNGVSDYKWSVGWVIVIQILSITVGAFVVCFRWLIIVSHRSIKFKILKEQFLRESSFAIISILSLRFNLLHFRFRKLYRTLKCLIRTGLSIMNLGMVWASVFVVFLCFLVKKFFSLLTRTNGSTKCEELMHFKGRMLYNDQELEIWRSRIVEKNMKRLMDASKRDAPTHLIALLSKTFHRTPLQPQSLLSIMQHREQDNFKFAAISQYSMIVLTKIAAYSIPHILSDSLKEGLKEALELMSFVEKKLKAEGFNYKEREIFALFDSILEWFDCIQRTIIKPAYERIPNNTDNSATGGDQEADLRRALLIIEGLRDSNVREKTRYEICDSILENRNVYTSITELYAHIEEAFVNILRSFLNDLPIAIFREYSEGSFEESEARTSRAIKFMCILELLEDKVTLSSWPDQLNINKRNPTSVALLDTATENTVNINPLPPDDVTSQEIQSANIL